MSRASYVAAVRDDIMVMKDLIADMESDLEKVEKGRKAPGVRIRKHCQELKSIATVIRTAILDLNKME